MKRALVLLVAAAGCAKGSGSLIQQDAAVDARVDARIDAAPMTDAPMIDAPMIDAPMIDAPMIDAPMIDAPMIDAPMVDASMADAPPDACVPVVTQLLVNPAFDLTPAGTSWQQTVIDPAYPIVTQDGFAAHTTAYKAWLGGIEADSGTVTDSLYQTVTIPAGTTQLVLSAVYAVGTDESSTDTAVYDTAKIELTQTSGTSIVTVRSFSNRTTTTGWVALTHTFTQNLAGQSVRVRMTSTNDFLNATSFYFDTLSLLATHCP